MIERAGGAGGNRNPPAPLTGIVAAVHAALCRYRACLLAYRAHCARSQAATFWFSFGTKENKEPLSNGKKAIIKNICNRSDNQIHLCILCYSYQMLISFYLRGMFYLPILSKETQRKSPTDICLPGPYKLSL